MQTYSRRPSKKRIIRMLEGPCAERVYTRLPAPDPDNTGVGNAFLSLFTAGRRALLAKGMLFLDEKHSFYFVQKWKRRKDYEN